MKFFIIALLLLQVIFVSAESSKEVYKNIYKQKGCKGDVTKKELVLTLDECDKGSKYSVDDSDVLKCDFQDSFCVDQKSGECAKRHILNKCVDDAEKGSHKYILGSDPSPFVIAFFVIGVFSAIMYVNKNKKANLPIPNIPQPVVEAATEEKEEEIKEEEIKEEEIIEDDIKEEDIIEEEKLPAIPKPTGNATKDVENHLTAILNKLQVAGPITKIGDCKYQIGSKKVTMQILGGYLVVRVGGGFMKFEEWIQRFGRKEGLTIAGELVKGVGVGTLSSHGSHTIKPIPYKK